MTLEGRVALVTGAGQGIGKAYALGLAEAGAKVALLDVYDPAPVAEEIRARGGEAISGAADVTSTAAVAAVVTAAEQRFGAIHVLVNNAALYTALKKTPIAEISSEEWDRVMAVNTRGPFECVKAVLPIMRRQRYGKIINIASGTVYGASVGLLHYVSSKGAVIAMTRAMARELGDDGIAVNCISPGFTESEMALERAQRNRDVVLAGRAFKRPETPEDLVGTVVFLASAASDFITGQNIVVDGGNVMQ
jgi:NAD(P)-dependent dehydrogenase (short-subunit alcohol dehydrogenase family)